MTAELPTQELIKRFVDSGLMVKKEIVEEIVRRGDVHEYLSKIMRDDKYWESGNEGDGWASIHSLFILGLKKDDKAFEILKSTLAWRAEELGDWVTEDLPSIFFSFGSKYFDKIREIALDASLDLYVRTAAIDALCALGIFNSGLTEKAAEFCKQLIKEEKHQWLTALVLPNMAEVQDEELFEMVKEFYAISAHAKEVTNLEDLVELHAGSSKLPVHKRAIKDPWKHFSKENLDYLYGANYSKKKESKMHQEPIKKKKIGRNQPCPCGSGLKYKKCCLIKEWNNAGEHAWSQGKILQLKIVLNGIKPPVWRRFLVKDSISFHGLHEIIQTVMGWENYHLYKFEGSNTRLEPDDEGRLFVDAMWMAFHPEMKTMSANKTRLNEFMKEEKQKFSYLYDFGDSWWHTIVVEKILEGDESQKCPVSIAGKRACPPEDCGGVWGYEELLEIQKDKNHPKYEERIVNWLGEDFDPERFDIDEVNKTLSRFSR